MLVQTVVYVTEVKMGKNKNWLVFGVYAGAFDKNRKYTINYCGTELEHSLSFTDQQSEQLREKLRADFGYPPFDLKKAKRTLGEGKEYTVIYGKDTI